VRNFGLQLNPNRSSCASNARIKTFVRRAATKNHDLRPWDDCVGWSSVAGLVLLGNLTYHYLKRGLQLEAISHPAILGLLLVILGFQTFGFTLLMEVAKRAISRSRQ